MTWMNGMTVWRALAAEESGQDLIEYSLLLAFVALAAAGVLVGIGDHIAGIFSTVNSNLAAANASAAP